LQSAPALAARIAAFWQGWNAGDRAAAIAALRPHFEAIENAPARIRAGVVDPAFAAEAESWLDATVLWGKALRQSLDQLDAVADGVGAAGSRREEIDGLVAQAKAIRDIREPHSRNHPRIGEGVVDAFVADAGQVAEKLPGRANR
jgi:hyaluronoglucosaminidase